MKLCYAHYALYLLLFCSCEQNSSSETNVFDKNIRKSTIKNDTTQKGCILAGDTSVNYILKEKSSLSIKLNIEFSSGEKAGHSFYLYKFKQDGAIYKFLSSYNSISDRSIYINGVKAKIDRLHLGNLNINDMNINIDYADSDIYLMKNNSSQLLIVSYPINWTGLMTRFAFFQLIDSKKMAVTEFIAKDG